LARLLSRQREHIGSLSLGRTVCNRLALVNEHEIEGVLDCYTLEEILEYNDLSLQDALLFLVEQEFLELPKYRPLEFEE
jgi:hypothetical protein